MKQLRKENYHLVLPFLREVTFNHAFADSVVNGDANGIIYVDSYTNPKTFYIYHAYGMSLILGNSENKEFNNSLTNYLLNNYDNKKCIEWLQVYPYNWLNKLKVLFDGNIILKKNEYEFINYEQHKAKIIENTRVNFEFLKDKYLDFNKLNKQHFYNIKRTTKKIFNDFKGSVVPKSFWKDAATFTMKGIGYSILQEEKVLSTAFSAFIHNNKLELGIETLKTYQGKGLAAITCSALIDYCLLNDYVPVWSCRLENTGSVKLAQKLGFEPIKYLPCYMIRL